MKSNFFQIALLLLLFNNCKDKYDFKSNGGIGNLVIDGNITDGPGPYFLKLSTTAGVYLSPAPLTGASIDIVDNTGSHESYVEIGKGKYKLNGAVVKGVKGGAYSIEIILSDGRHYKSTQEAMPLLQSQDSASFEVAKIRLVSSEGVPVDNLVVKVFLNSILPKTDAPAYFRWSVDEVYRLYPTCFPNPFNTCPPTCYISLPVTNSNLEIVNASEYTDRRLDNILLMTRDVDHTFQSKHYFNINQYSLNKNAFAYWRKVNGLVTRKGSIFDTPAANLQGNVFNVYNSEERVFGYFEASLQYTTHVGVARGYIPGDLENPCRFTGLRNFGNNYPKVCIDCLSIDGSTNTQPSWFE